MNEACRFTKKGEVIYRLQYMLLDEYGQGSVYSSVDELLKKIENMVLDCRSADVVEVVRCKDCKNASTTEYLYCTNDGIAECQSVYCGHYKIYMELNHYCSHGERRE